MSCRDSQVAAQTAAAAPETVLPCRHRQLGAQMPASAYPNSSSRGVEDPDVKQLHEDSNADVIIKCAVLCVCSIVNSKILNAVPGSGFWGNGLCNRYLKNGGFRFGVLGQGGV